MIFPKSLFAGIASALATMLICLVVSLAAPLFILFLQSRTSGSGGIGAVSAGLEWIVGPGLIAFAGGFFWQFRRSSRAASNRQPR